MRKGGILIFLGKNEKKTDCLNFLKDKLNKVSYINSSSINVNGYDICACDEYSQNYCRGCRPEICYINRNIDMNDTRKECQRYLHINTEMYSNRKQPIRFIDSFKDVDIDEILDDNYALENTIDSMMLQEWNNHLKRILDESKVDFKKEYDCKWNE